jgi:hypothetical protein
MPAITAMRWNPVLRVFAERLRAKGKRPKHIIAAVMRRLLILAYGYSNPANRSTRPSPHDPSTTLSYSY